jgi:hypothetical protein
MLRWSPQRRTVIVDGLRDLANLVMGALVLGRAVGERPWSMWWLAAGVLLWVTLLGAAVLVAGGGRDA